MGGRTHLGRNKKCLGNQEGAYYQNDDGLAFFSSLLLLGSAGVLFSIFSPFVTNI
jgi:hypothetical protein